MYLRLLRLQARVTAPVLFFVCFVVLNETSTETQGLYVQPVCACTSRGIHFLLKKMFLVGPRFSEPEHKTSDHHPTLNSGLCVSASLTALSPNCLLIMCILLFALACMYLLLGCGRVSLYIGDVDFEFRVHLPLPQ